MGTVNRSEDGRELENRKIPIGISLPSHPLKQLSSLLFEINCSRISSENLPAEVATRAGATEVPDRGVGDQEQSSTWLTSVFSEDQGRGWGRTRCLASSADRFPFPFSAPELSSLVHCPPISILACDHIDRFEHQLSLLRVSGPAYQAMVGCTN